MAHATQPRPVSGGDETAKGVSRRGDIVTAAVEVFADRGYDGASVREIAERASIAKGNLTYYFAVKDDLLYEVVAELHDAFLELASAWPRRPVSIEDLRSALRGHVELVCGRVRATRVAYECFRYLSSDRRTLIAEKRRRYEAALQKLIIASPCGSSRNTKYAAARTRTVLGMLNWPYQWFSPSGPMTPFELGEAVADMAVRALSV
jgi:AcrR family transcriptional regulator